MAQVVIHQHQREHRLGDRRGAQSDARIVAAGRDDLDAVAVDVDRAARESMMLEVGLSAMLTTMSWPEEMPPSTPPALFERKPAGVSSSRCCAALLLDGREAGADLHALDRVDAHHRVRDVGIEPVEHRLAESRRHAGRDHVHARADRIARRDAARSCMLRAPRAATDRGRRTDCRTTLASDFGSRRSGPSCAR